MAYVVQAALGGHAIPIDAGTMAALRVLDLVTDKDVPPAWCRGWNGPWPSRKGSSSARCSTSSAPTFPPIPTRSAIRDILLQINPECAEPAAQAAGRRPAEAAGRRPQPEKAAKDEGSRAASEKPPRRGRNKRPPTSRREPAADRRRRNRRRRRTCLEAAAADKALPERRQETTGLRGPLQTQAAMRER